jgi:hypothetical protein
MSCSPDGMLQSAVCSAMGPSLLAMVHHTTDVLAVHKCATLPTQQNEGFDITAHEISHTLKAALTISVLNPKYFACDAQSKNFTFTKLANQEHNDIH